MSVGWIVNLVLGFWIVEELAAPAALLLHWLVFHMLLLLSVVHEGLADGLAGAAKKAGVAIENVICFNPKGRREIRPLNFM